MPGLTPVSETARTLTPLAERVDTPEILIPGLLPALDLFPGSVYPKDNTIIPAVVGIALVAVGETTLGLTPLSEA